MTINSRPAMKAAIPIPALVPVLRALEGAYVVAMNDGGMDAGRVGKLVEDIDVDVGVDVEIDVAVDTDVDVGGDVGVDVGVDVDVDTDGEGVEDGVMLLLMDEVTEDAVIELDTPCRVKDSGEGA